MEGPRLIAIHAGVLMVFIASRHFALHNYYELVDVNSILVFRINVVYLRFTIAAILF